MKESTGPTTPCVHNGPTTEDMTLLCLATHHHGRQQAHRRPMAQEAPEEPALSLLGLERIN